MSIEPGALRWIAPHLKQTTIGAVLFTQTQVEDWKLVPGKECTAWWSACALLLLSSVAIQLLNGRWYARCLVFRDTCMTHYTCPLKCQGKTWCDLHLESLENIHNKWIWTIYNEWMTYWKLQNCAYWCSHIQACPPHNYHYFEYTWLKCKTNNALAYKSTQLKKYIYLIFILKSSCCIK